jgi:hypothetical protein
MLSEVRIGFTAGTSWVSKAIRWADFALDPYDNKIPSMVNHVLLHFIWMDGPEYIHESQQHGVESSPFSHIARALDAHKILRLIEMHLPLNQEQRDEVYRRARNMHAVGYDFGALARYMVWARVRGKEKDEMLRRDDPDRLTCNQYVAACIGGPRLIPYIDAESSHPEYVRLTPETFFHTIFGKSSPEYLKGQEAAQSIIDTGHTLVP